VRMVGDPEDTRKRRVRLTPRGENIIKLLNGALVDTAFSIVENMKAPL
jgi:DNA-binding MarR family transcriptional regulator